MVIEHEVLPFLEWLLPGENSPYGALVFFLVLAALAILGGVLVGFILSVFRHGPLEASYNVAQVIAEGVADFAAASMRRAGAIARLAIKESIRGRVIVVFIVFAVFLMYAPWYLARNPENPARLYISFVMTATKFLVFVMALFLSALSLPADIKNRTIYSVVTKPVRSLEIVVGRILGFSAVATAILLAMCVVSYFFVVMGLDHTHTIEENAAKIRGALERGETSELAMTSRNAGHRHRVALDEEGKLYLDDVSGHTHELVEDNGVLLAGPPLRQFQARVPQYGKLSFLNRSGGPGEGISVGHEWTYRRFIEGRTLAGAVWLFRDLREDDFKNGLPVELTLGVYRTHKGDIESGILGTLELRSPSGRSRSVGVPFVAREYQTQSLRIPRQLDVVTSEGQRRADADIFQDLVEDGELELVVRCESPGQYFGMAQADLYLRAAERSFFANFLKAYFGLWMQMVIVIAFGVTFSTILSAPIALLATLSTLVIGHCTTFIAAVLQGQVQANPILSRLLNVPATSEGAAMGGGPLESIIRMLTQMNVMAPLDIGWLNNIVGYFDLIVMGLVAAASKAVPDFTRFDTANYLANGFNVNGSLVGQQFAIFAAFILFLSVTGYFLLKTREIAA